MCPPQLFLEPLLARNIGSKPSLSPVERGRTNRKHEHNVHADALIILLHLLQLDRLLLTKTKLIHSPTTQSRGGTIIQYSNALFGFLAACSCRFLEPGGASEGGRQRVIFSSESGELHELTVNCGDCLGYRSLGAAQYVNHIGSKWHWRLFRWIWIISSAQSLFISCAWSQKESIHLDTKKSILMSVGCL